MDKTKNTIGQTFEINVYDGDEIGQVWVAKANTIAVKRVTQSDFLLIGRCHVVLTETQDISECKEVDNTYVLPPIDTIGCLNDGRTVVKVLEHIEDVMPFE